jgi:ABC-type nitrate/sulfonate/bicarbonate transport system substrate-binding protein
MHTRNVLRRGGRVTVGVVTAALLLAGVGGVVASGATKPKPQKTVTLTEIDTTPGLPLMPLNVTELVTGQLFHLNVSPIDVTGSSAAVEEFAGGTGDLLTGGMDEAVTLYQKQLSQVTVVGTTLRSNVWVLVSLKGSSYTSLASLAGQNVGVSAIGAVSQYGLIYGLDQAKLSTTSVNYVALGGAATELAGLENGTVKAAVLNAPTVQDALSAGTVQIVYDMRTQPYAAGLVFVRNNTIGKDPTAVCNYMQAFQASLTKIYAQPTWTLDEATGLYGAGVSATDLKTALTENLTDHWTKTNTFPLSLYNSTKAILLASGFTSAGYPTYSQLTKHIPKHDVVVKGKKKLEAC